MSPENARHDRRLKAHRARAAADRIDRGELMRAALAEGVDPAAIVAIDAPYIARRLRALAAELDGASR
jgi:hypothetical protein